MAGRRRRVLVLAYFFPPLGGAGVQRTLKFVRYLESLGWDATVVTTKSRLYRARDPSLLAEVPAGTRVIRTRALPLARWIGMVFYRLRLLRLYAWVTWPDGGFGWAPFAALAAVREARRERPDVVYSSAPPQAGHFAALVVRRVTGIPWVADFRDEWSADAFRAGQPRLLSRLAARAERTITSTASRVVVAADYFRLAGLPQDDLRRVEIVNGADVADFPNPPSDPPGERFVLAHVGTVYGIRDPTPVLRAIERLVAQGELDGDRLEVRLVGSLWLDEFLPPPGIHVERTGYVDHARAVAEMCAATVLLLYIPGSSLAPSGKLFEYLASGRPVLCIAPAANLASRLVREFDAGVVTDPGDDAGIEHAILTLWRRWQAEGLPGQLHVRRRSLERYSRQAGAVRLARVLEDVSRV